MLDVLSNYREMSSMFKQEVMECKREPAYDKLMSSNVLTLPSCRTLRDYKNAIKPHAGFNPTVIQELIKTTELFTGHQRNEDSAEPGV